MRIHVTTTVVRKAWAVAVRLLAKVRRFLQLQPADDGQAATLGHSGAPARPGTDRVHASPRWVDGVGSRWRAGE